MNGLVKAGESCMQAWQHVLQDETRLCDEETDNKRDGRQKRIDGDLSTYKAPIPPFQGKNDAEAYPN